MFQPDSAKRTTTVLRWIYPALYLLTALPLMAADRPNILLIMADDLGYSDLGCYGSEIQTPNLDALAGDGLRFSQFYNTGRCWPTRASLLTGYYPQSVRRDKVPGVASGNAGNRPASAPLICQPLKQAGYRTYHTGKWHLDGMPIETGFDRSYYLKDQHRFFNPTLHWKDDVKLPPVPKGTDYYATVALGDHVLECLENTPPSMAISLSFTTWPSQHPTFHCRRSRRTSSVTAMRIKPDGNRYVNRDGLECATWDWSTRLSRP